MHPTKKELEDKRWFRLIKVVYLGFSVFIFASSIFVGYVIYDLHQPAYIYNPPTSGFVPDIAPTYYSDKEINNFAKKLQVAGASKSEIEEFIRLSKNDQKSFQKEGSLMKVATYSLLSIVITLVLGHGFLLLVKFLFFYIAYGKKRLE